MEPIHEKQSEAAPHALFVPYPCQGHINPFLEVALRLSSLGVVTTVATLDTFVARFASSHTISKQNGALIKEVQVASPDKKSFVSIIGVPDGLPPEQDRDLINDPQVGPVILTNLEGAVVELVRSLADEGRTVTHLFGDFFIPWTPHVAHVLNLPEVVIWPQNASCFAVYSHVDLLISNGYNPFQHYVSPFGPKKAMDMVSCIPGLPPLHPSELNFGTGFGPAALQYTESLIRVRFDGPHKALAFLGNTFYELEPSVCEALHPNFIPVGPFLPPSSLEPAEAGGLKGSQHHVSSRASLWAEDECIGWLDKQPPRSVVYVSFGTLTKLSIAQAQELAKGLASSGQKFIWVIRKNMVWEDIREVQEALPQGFLEDTKEQGKVISWAPQARVLAHAAVGGFFSHCGWNSCVEALTVGVPILGWPFLYDQFTNCWFLCNQLKVGLKVETSHENIAGCAEVARCLKALMVGEEAQSRRTCAEELKHVFRRSISDSSGRPYQNLKRFVNSLVA